jgi:hypothetical protein
MKIVVRKSVPSDHPFVYATYIRNRWFDKANTTTLKRSTWSKLQHSRLEGILEAGIVVACLSDDLDTIVGYALVDGEKPYSYVKLAWRSEGLGIKELLLKEVNK